MATKYFLLIILLTTGLVKSTYTMNTERMKYLATLKEAVITALDSDNATKLLKLKEVRNTRRFIRLENIRQKQEQDGLDQTYIISLQLPLSQQMVGLKETPQSTQANKPTSRTDGSGFEAAFKKNIAKRK